MQLSHTRSVVAAVFDDPNLVSVAGLVPLVRLAQRAGLTALAQDRLTVAEPSTPRPTIDTDDQL